MTPSPEEKAPSCQESEVNGYGIGKGDQVVISGMAGLYPKSRYIKDLEHILYNKVNPISADDLRWKYSHPEVSQFTGNVPDLDRFDAQFFKVHHRLALGLDSMSRKLLEQTYEALYDAGVSPEHLSGKQVGVYIGSCFSETEKVLSYAFTGKTGFGLAGCSKSMFANRISYWLNARGPSVSIDQACCSSTAALEAAYKAIIHGECESAIVGGANLCLHPQSSVHYARIMNISMDGSTKSFAEDAAGCARSEAINVLFLQKARDAKRLYAEVVYAKCSYVSIVNEETGPKYGFYRNPSDTSKFLKTFYDEAGVPPTLVEYVEAFGSAVPEADKSELEAIDDVFCRKRDKPLLVGSVTSNIGYGEAASGLSAITKVLLGYHNGVLAGNLHCSTPRRDVPALREGRLQLLSDHQEFPRRVYAAVNNLSVTGVNAHVLLNGHYKPKDLDRYKCNIPRLVTISGRQESAVERAIELLKSQPIDSEQIALLHSIHETNIAGHLGKGYVLLDSEADGSTKSLLEKVEFCDGAQRPLWFVYSGMGSQWAGMGAQLMRIPIFAAAIEKCHKVLEPKGIDLVHIITTPDKAIFDNILHSFVGIAAVQIGLTDVLKELGIVPDNIIGHSVGELGCAYADGCLTAEEMILCAYSRGKVSLETPVIRGSMAAVGLGAQQLSKFCPPDIDIACHNSAESCTISGPADSMRTVVAQLKTLKVFAKEVPCSNIAYHSRYIAEAGPALLKYLKDIIKTPKLRSERWVSTSVPQERWDEPTAKYCSAEYQTNNLLNPVLFEETSSLIPADAVLVEVAPHGLLQAILKRALPDTATNIPLTLRGADDSVLVLLGAIGKLYVNGYNPRVRVLYPKVDFPVSTGTPFLSHFVDWVHQERWPLPLYHNGDNMVTASCTFLISIHGDNSYLHGHVIGNKILLPTSYILVAVWDMLAMLSNLPKKKFSVKFTDVKIYTQPILHAQKVVRLSVSLHRGCGHFEVMEENSKIASGYVNRIDQSVDVTTESNVKDIAELNTEDVYRILQNRGFSYSGDFRSIYNTDLSVSKASIIWNDNWVTFIEGLLQLNMLKSNTIVQPAKIGSMVIDLNKHSMSKVFTNENKTLITCNFSEIQDKTWTDGVIIKNVGFRNIHELNKAMTSLLSLKFIPRHHSGIDISTSLYVMLQIVGENKMRNNINVLGLCNGDSKNTLFEEMARIAVEGIPQLKIVYQEKTINSLLSETKQNYKNVDVILTNNLSNANTILQRLQELLQPQTFVITQEKVERIINYSKLYNIVSVLKNSESQLELLYWKPIEVSNGSIFTVKSEADLVTLHNTCKNMYDQRDIFILTPHPPIREVLEAVQKWKREPENKRIFVLMIDEFKYDATANLSLKYPLAFNVFQNEVWGGEYYLPLKEEQRDTNKVELQSKVIGDINSLHWVKAPELPRIDALAVSVHYTGINMKDVRKALGLTPANCKNNGYGMDFSGVTERGERIMGLLPTGTAASNLMAIPELIWPVPESWSLEDAATVPFAYLYAYYCLFIKTRNIVEYDKYSVLIHCGTGALGQAAISIALARGWTVFTTVRSVHKKRFLIKLFPKLNENHIGTSRDISFRDMVINATKGKGCNVVLCPLKGELKNASFDCCKNFGTLLDISIIMNNENYILGMNNLNRDRNYVTADFTSIFDDMHSTDIQTLHGLISQGIARGEVRPLTRMSFDRSETVRAFRLLSASHHCGRVLLRIADELSPVLSRNASDEIPCHVVICDPSPLGQQLIEKLTDHGIRKIYLYINGPTAGYIKYEERQWKKQNIHVEVTNGLFTNETDITDILQKAGNTGPVEGIYIVGDFHESIIHEIDIASRSLCVSLKRFTILNIKGNGFKTCIQRTKSKLPATFLDISALVTYQDADGASWYRGAAAAIEQAWRTTDTVLLAVPRRTPHLSLIQQIAKLADINVSPEVSGDTSLEQLGLPTQCLTSVCVLLRDEYSTSLDEAEIPLLTLTALKEIEGRARGNKLKEVKGLETFFSFVHSDELLATTEMVFLPTLGSAFGMNEGEFDMSGSYLCVIPGLEGIHGRFTPLCERLKLPAFVLQPGFDREHEPPRHLALRYSEILIKKAGVKKSFYILGYETGVFVALELAAVLEDHGMTGMVFVLGDGPLEMQSILGEQLAAYSSEDALQEGIIRHIFALMTHNANPKVLEEALRACDGSWSTRVEACVRLLLGLVPHTAQYARTLLHAAYARVLAAADAAPPNTTLRSRIVLLRASDRADRDTSSLQQYSSRPIDIINLSTPIAHVASDMRVPDIINSHLDADTLQAFENKNLCDSYVIKLDGFSTLQ